MHLPGLVYLYSLQISESVAHLVTFNLFLRNGNAMLPKIPTMAARAERPPSTDSRTHCRSAYPYVTGVKRDDIVRFGTIIL